jgi:hypothetical protein
MKTNRASSLGPTSVTATKTNFSLPTFLRSKLRSRAVAVLILLSGLPFHLYVPTALAQGSTGGKSGTAQQWSVQVDKVDPGDVIIERSFRDAIYENLLEELAKTKQFKHLYRSGDRNAKDVPRLLILKTTVQAYAPGSETRRAVTTVSGATKLNVRIQLLTPEGHKVLEHVVAGNVRFIGSNLRATHNLAHSVAATLKRSTLPGDDRCGPRTGNRKDVQVKPVAYGREIPSHPNRLEPGEGNRNAAKEMST